MEFNKFNTSYQSLLDFAFNIHLGLPEENEVDEILYLDEDYSSFFFADTEVLIWLTGSGHLILWCDQTEEVEIISTYMISCILLSDLNTVLRAK